MNKQYERYLKIILIFLDLLVLNLILILGEIFFAKHLPVEYKQSYFEYKIMANVGWLLLSFFGATYAKRIIQDFINFLKRTIQIYFVWIILILCYLFFTRELLLSRFYIALTIAAFGLGLLANRFLYLAISNYLKLHKRIVKRVIILGLNDTARKLTEYLEQEGVNTKMMGYIEDDDKVNQLAHYPVLAGINDTLPVARDLKIEEIYSTIMPEENKIIYDLMYQAEKECIRFKIVPNLSLFIKRDIHVDYFRDLPVLSLRNEALDDVGNRFKKRALDIAVSVPVIIFILSWLMPLLGLFIYLESGSPVFFKQLRTGKNLRPFSCWKLRSMRVNKNANKLQTTKEDPRVTRIGRFLRKTSLDEFPQFINVFKGDMSLVGPRPHMLKHTTDYSEVVDEYSVRQFAKPGITGWAQINGYRGEITSAEQIQMRVNLDLWYIENWTLWLDIQILFLTIYKILKSDNKAY